ncbi:MAG: acyl-CoA thioesterase [Acidobacteria bacterium]|nr:MAG: acyl-CoA thioesterase [Acidobacteriota bacterium]
MENSFRQQATTTPLRVRYAETDQMGIVYYANYFVWFEIGRTEYCRQLGFAYKEMEEQDGLYITVAEARCRYKAPARYDDELVVHTRLTDCRKRVLVFRYEVERPLDDTLVAEGETVHVVTDRQGRPRTMPAKYLDLFVARLPDELDRTP